MLEEELMQLVKKVTSEKCEKQHIELKKAAGSTPSKLYDTLSSFSNQPMTEYEIYSYEAFKRRTQMNFELLIERQ